MRSIFRLVLAVSLAGSLVALLSPAAAPAAAARRESTQQILQRLGGAPCEPGSDFTCVTIAVPRDHFASTSAQPLKRRFR